MRIIAGDFRGRRLDAPDWPGLRPTSDRLRETLFNVLGAQVRGARVLDGYAGTGAVGLEALSRGAAHVTFVEADTRAVRLIERNLARCAVGDRHVIIRARFADTAARGAPGTFDLILLDPPYGTVDLEPLLASAAPLLAPDGLLALERARRDEAPVRAGPLARVRDIVSGDSALSLYRAQGGADQDAGAS